MAGRAEDRHPGGIAYELTASRGDCSAQQHHGSDLGVASSELHGLIHAAARTCRANAGLVHALLGGQPRVGGVDVSGPFPVGDPPLLLWIVRPGPATLSVAAIVQCEHVEAALGRCRRQAIPGRPIAVARMQQEQARPRASRRKVGRLQRDPVRRLQIDRARRGWCWRCRRLRLRRERHGHGQRHEDGKRNHKGTALAGHETFQSSTTDGQPRIIVVCRRLAMKRRQVFAIGLVVAIGVGAHAAGTPKPGVDWPQFRGIRAGGVAEGFPLAEAWDIPSGRGVRWKTPIPGLGLASPIVWGDLVCLSTSISGQKDAGLKVGLYGDVRPVTDDTEHEWRIYCLDKKSGAVRWQQTVLKAVPKIKRHTKASHANSTLATDGERLIAFFGSEGLYAYDLTWEATVETGSRRPRRRMVQRSDGAVGNGQLADPSRQRRRRPGGRSEGLVPGRV